MLYVFMTITILQAILGLAIALIGIEMVNNPPTTRGQRWFWRGCFIVIGIILLVLAYFQWKGDDAKQKDFDLQFNGLKTNYDNGKNELASQIGAVKSKQNSLWTQYQNLQEQLLTNQFINPELRQRIIDSSRQFDELGADVLDITNMVEQLQERLRLDKASAQIQKEKDRRTQEKAAQDSLAERGPYYDYAVKTLELLADKFAKRLGDKMVPEYSGIPDFVDIGMDSTNIADVKFQKDTNWDFVVFIDLRRQYATVKCSAGYLDIVPSGQTMNCYLHEDLQNYTQQTVAITNAEKAIAANLGDLVTMEYLKFTTTNR